MCVYVGFACEQIICLFATFQRSSWNSDIFMAFWSEDDHRKINVQILLQVAANSHFTTVCVSVCVSPSFLLMVCCLSAQSWHVRSERGALLLCHCRSNTHQEAAGRQTVKTEPDLEGNYQCLLNVWNGLSKTRVNDAAWLSLFSWSEKGDYCSLELHSLVFGDVG